ncbi:hypothetical protein Pla110_06870 [Polystyrenella longa]|uniref:Uncharacterized protein n=2 Tax=Polystyrenella longa TaxID=2528007 RepID=A0A518CIB3_9PLAN|nr:hypothetical protein Pla110_06870 [Polystyrenella longa]
MADFSESLTVRIVGDSRGLDRELGKVVRSLTDFENRLKRVGQFDDLFSRLARQVGSLSRPLRGVNQLLTQIGQQLVWLSQYPVTLDVSPALAGLQRVSQVIDLLMLKLQQLAAMASAGATGGLAGGVTGNTGASPGPIRQFASGGMVSGPGGIDRVPAMLTAGEYVLQRPVVQMLGRNLLDRLNEGRGEGVRQLGQQTVENRNRSDVHHYGGFTFNLSQPVPMSELLQSIRQDRLKLRTRRG